MSEFKHHPEDEVTGEIPAYRRDWWGSPFKSRSPWLPYAFAALLAAGAATVWSFAIAVGGMEPVEVWKPVPMPGPTQTVISGWTERETEYIDVPSLPAASVPQGTTRQPERVVVTETVPVPGERVTVVERQAGPIEYRTVPGPTRTVTEYRTEHEHHHHEAPAETPSGGA